MSFLFYFFVLCLTPFISLYFAGKIGAAFIKTSANIHGNKLFHSAYNHCICTKTKIKIIFEKIILIKTHLHPFSIGKLDPKYKLLLSS